MRSTALLFLLAFCSVGCANTGTDVAQPAAALAEAGRLRGSEARLIIRQASIAVSVESSLSTVSIVETAVSELGGHVSRSTAQEASAELVVRVPSDQLDSFLDRVSTLGEEVRRSVTGTDVTDSYADTQAEIKNLRSLRDRLRELLQRADLVEEVLQVERELTRVQTKLDSLVARKQRMDTDLSLSLVNISLTEREAKRVLGPLGLLYEGTKWLVIKLFIISP